jgi:hypothetical protein
MILFARSLSSKLPSHEVSVFRNMTDASNTCSYSIFERRIFATMGIALAGCALIGCSSQPARVAPPNFDPPAIATAMLDAKDSNSDNMVTADELGDWSGFRASFAQIDANNDGKLDRTEIERRFQDYVETRVGLQSLTVFVTANGKPVPDAVVDFIPEDLLADLIKPARATTNAAGSAPVLPVDGGIPLVAPGFYRVKISKKQGEKELIPPQFNTATTLGFEVMTRGGGEPARFDVANR